MKTLSLWQPWATLIAIGAKQIETRSWPTQYRGPLVIHASKRHIEAKELAQAIYALRPSDEEQIHTWQYGSFNYFAIKAIYDFHNRPYGAFIPQLPLGAALCVVDLVDCVPVEKLTDISEQECKFGNYASGRFGWKLANVRRFREPIPLRGMQRLFESTPPLSELC